jgi:hypothetical protein
VSFATPWTTRFSTAWSSPTSIPPAPLSGYLYGALETVEISAEEEELFSADVDDLFGGDDGEWDALFRDEGAGGDGGTSDTGGPV